MVRGLGTDIIEIERIRASLARHNDRFRDKVFTQKEQEYCLSHADPAPYFAGRFAAKEAVVKALGCGFRDGITWLDVEVVHDALGKPCIKLSELLQHKYNYPSLLLSISHCRAYATATAVLA